MLGRGCGVQTCRQILPQRDEKLRFVLMVVEIQLHKPRMAEMAVVDLAGAVVHEVRQHIVLKPVIPQIRRVQPPHLQRGDRLLEIGDHRAEIEKRIADAGVKKMLPQKKAQLLDHGVARQARLIQIDDRNDLVLMQKREALRERAFNVHADAVVS